jgi:hypothetical protein
MYGYGGFRVGMWWIFSWVRWILGRDVVDVVYGWSSGRYRTKYIGKDVVNNVCGQWYYIWMVVLCIDVVDTVYGCGG